MVGEASISALRGERVKSTDGALLTDSGRAFQTLAPGSGKFSLTEFCLDLQNYVVCSVRRTKQPR